MKHECMMPMHALKVHLKGRSLTTSDIPGCQKAFAQGQNVLNPFAVKVVVQELHSLTCEDATCNAEHT